MSMLQNDVIFISVASVTLPMKTSPKIHQGPMGRSSPMKPEMHWGVLGPDLISAHKIFGSRFIRLSAHKEFKYLCPDYRPIKEAKNIRVRPGFVRPGWPAGCSQRSSGCTLALLHNVVYNVTLLQWWRWRLAEAEGPSEGILQKIDKICLQ